MIWTPSVEVVGEALSAHLQSAHQGVYFPGYFIRRVLTDNDDASMACCNVPRLRPLEPCEVEELEISPVVRDQDAVGLCSRKQVLGVSGARHAKISGGECTMAVARKPAGHIYGNVVIDMELCHEGLGRTENNWCSIAVWSFIGRNPCVNEGLVLLVVQERS